MPDATVSRLSVLDTPTLSDALDQLGLPGAVFGLSPMTVQRRIVGRAMTVKLGPPVPGGPKRHLGAGAIMAANAGDVIVIEHGRTDVSGWGGLLSRGALVKSIAGVVIDGAFRDLDEGRELGFPIYARAAVPITARGRVAEHSFNHPISVCGVRVEPGDWVLADGSGVVFISHARATDIIAAAEAVFSREQLMVRDIEAGRPIGDVLGADYENMLKKGSP
jgi:regulator of RNase E activity RraA